MTTSSAIGTEAQRPRNARSLRGWFVDSLAGVYCLGVSAMLLTLALALVAGGVRTADSSHHIVLNDINGLADSIRAIVALVLAIAAIIGARHLARRSKPYPPATFVLLASVGSLALHALLIWNVDSEWAGDYLRYWNHAQQMVDRVDDPLVFNIYSQRALLFAYPVVKMFGADATTAMKLVNALALLGIQWLAYDAMRILRGPQAAQALWFLLLTMPLPAYAILIPSHDLWGLFFFTFAFWAYVRSRHGVPRDPAQWCIALAQTAVAALAVHLLELQRAIGVMFALTFALVALGQLLLTFASGADRPDRAKAGFLAAVALSVLLLQPILMKLGHEVGWAEHRSDSRRAAQAMKLASHGGAMGTARSEWYARFAERFVAKTQQGPAASADFARSVVLSNFIHQPLDKLAHAAGNLSRMFEPGYPSDWDATLANPTRIDPSTRTALIVYANAFGLLLAAYAAASLVQLGTDRRPLPLPLLAVCGTIAGIALTLALLFENKPTNIFPAWLVWATLVAWQMASPKSSREGVSLRIRRGIGAFVALSAVLTGLWSMCLWAFPDARGRILDAWKLDMQQPLPPIDWQEKLAAEPPQVFERRHAGKTKLPNWVFREAAADAPRLQRYANSLFETLALPVPMQVGDRAVLTREICGIDPDRDGFEFFVFAPYRNASRLDLFALQASVNGALRRTVSLPLSGGTLQMVRIEHAFEPGRCQAIELALRSNVNRDRASWQAASHVEIWFPRTVFSEDPTDAGQRATD